MPENTVDTRDMGDPSVSYFVDNGPANLAEEAKADRAAGNPTWSTRGYADTEAFNRDT